MIGSRGVTPPDVVAGLGVLAELLKNIDPTLVGRLEELQAEERRIAEQRAALQVADAENQARVVQLEQRKAAVDAAANAVADREAACAASAEETARRQASFDAQGRVLDERRAALVNRTEELAKAEGEFATACESERGKIAAERQAAADQIARDRQQAKMAAQEEEATHAANIRRMHEVADGEITRQQRELTQREAAVAERERAISKRAGELLAVLGT
ncbi:MAG TPA: hypothetical protein VEQ62_04305 [Stellaceae bacterium]|jgi:hypothetical protein|nr:hypothetical protein [Stellaceae bacterium]